MSLIATIPQTVSSVFAKQRQDPFHPSEVGPTLIDDLLGEPGKKLDLLNTAVMHGFLKPTHSYTSSMSRRVLQRAANFHATFPPKWMICSVNIPWYLKDFVK